MNPINGIGNINEISYFKPVSNKTGTSESIFENFFNAALKVIEETNADQIESEKKYVDLATGKTDDILSVVLAQEKASASLNFTVQITNKIIESYREIMRIQL